MGKQGEFNFSGLATARRTDPTTSFKSADLMNEDGAKLLTRQQDAVLRALKANNGITAKALGLIMAQEAIERISWPHKRMAELVSKGYVRRFAEDNDRELECFITHEGASNVEGVGA
ncbi:hypothetical protein KAR91_28400 [Candidatus Pacearchaeota archaeon]|nr:hypothetical protein [Candidatus Pacearchaeota archaeon]